MGDVFVLLRWSEQRVAVVFVDFCRLLHNNQLTGTIPSTVGQLSSLQQL
jgi:hypothetical protein